MSETTVEQWVKTAIDKGIEACEGKYRENRNPMAAALFDPDPFVRAGVALMIKVIFEDHGVTLPVLKLAIDKEQDAKVRAMMRDIYEYIAGK